MYLDLEEKLLEYKEQYRSESAGLLKKIAEREEFAKLLKIAKPDKIADVRAVIARMDSYIEDTENILEMTAKLIKKTENAIKNENELLAKAEIIRKELIEHIKKNEPEKLELLEAMLSDDGSSH